MRIRSSTFPVDSSDLVEAIHLEIELVVRFHAKLLRLSNELFKIRKGDQARIKHDGRACESHGPIQAHNRRGSEVNVELVIIQAREIYRRLVFRTNCTSGLQESFERLDGERISIVINTKFHEPMIPRGVI